MAMTAGLIAYIIQSKERPCIARGRCTAGMDDMPDGGAVGGAHMVYIGATVVVVLLLTLVIMLTITRASDD